MLCLNKLRAQLRLKHRLERIWPRYVHLNRTCGIYADRGFRNWVSSNPHVYTRINQFLDRIVGPQDSFIDCGASFGWICVPLVSRLQLSHGSGKVLAIESDSNTFRLLSKSSERNKFDSRFIIENVFVGDSSTFVDFYSCSASGMSGGYLNGHIREAIEKNNESVTLTTVRSTTLDALVQKHNIQNVAAVKLDIEGGELPALRGSLDLIKSNESVVFIVEANSVTCRAAGYTVEDVWSFFQDLNFKVYTFSAELQCCLNACDNYDEGKLLDSGDLVATRDESVLFEKLGPNLTWK